jgi:hypothetical protein
MPTSDPTATTPNAAQRFTDHLAVGDDGWTLTETGWDVDRSVAVGSNFMVGNGYLGYRATSPEQEADGFVSLVVADTYDCADGRWRELTTAPNSLFVSVSIGDRRLRIEQASHVETSLDLRCGRFLQHTTHPVVDGVITVDVERFSSSANLHQIAQRVTISCDVDADITVEAGIDGDVWDLNGTHLPNLDLGTDATTVTACGRTGESGVTVAVARSTTLRCGSACTTTGSAPGPQPTTSRSARAGCPARPTRGGVLGPGDLQPAGVAVHRARRRPFDPGLPVTARSTAPAARRNGSATTAPSTPGSAATTGDELCPDFFFTDVLTGRPIRNHFNVWQMHVSPRRRHHRSPATWR